MSKQDSGVLPVTGEDFSQLFEKGHVRPEIAEDGECDCNGPNCRKVIFDSVGDLCPNLCPSEEKVLKRLGMVAISFDRADGVNLSLLNELGWPSSLFFTSGLTTALYRATLDPLELMLIDEAEAEREAAFEAEEALNRYTDSSGDKPYWSESIDSLLELLFGPSLPNVVECVESGRTPIRKPAVLCTTKKTKDGKKVTQKTTAPEVIGNEKLKQKSGVKELRAREYDKCDNRTTIRGATIEVEVISVRAGKRSKKKYIFHATPRSQR